ncbi:MAG: cytochrome c biogenesis protein CcdA [Nakamurella sp.]
MTGQRSNRLLIGGAIILSIVGTLGAVLQPAAAPLAAGFVLLIIGFAVMAPCSIQMALTMSRVIEARGSGANIRRSAGLFALGYIGFYLPVAVLLGGLAWLLGPWSWIAVLAGAVVSLTLGLAALQVLSLGALSRCRGPLWLLRTGRASFQRPLKAGVAFGQYCATCCGPYVLAVAVIGGGTRSFAIGAGLVLAYAVFMAVPFLAPAVLRPNTYSEIGRLANTLTPKVQQVTGVVLIGLSIALMPAIASGVLS